MEIEAKFRIADETAFATVLGLERIGPYTLSPGVEEEQQRNTYYDTPAGLLHAARHGLRIRRIGPRAIVTLKGPNEVRDAVHSRAEWEVEADTPDPRSWPESEARHQALALLGERADELQELLQIETYRRRRCASRDGSPIAELSLDEGEIFAGGRTQRLRELELELLPAGTPADLDALVAALGELITLIPEPRSKLERGLALLKDNL